MQAAFNSASKKYPYHNWVHTQYVIQASLEIIEGTPSLTENEKQHIELAAIFHDVGFTITREEHEQAGAKMAGDFLRKNNYPEEQVIAVEQIISATKMGHQPANISENIIQDADLAHIGKKNYGCFYNGLFQEIKMCIAPNLTYEEWKTKCLDFFNGHTFRTKYAKEKFAPIKELNKQNIMALENEMLPIKDSNKSKKNSKKKRKKKNEIPEKGIETMFRVSLRNHTNLSRIADNKANTLISVNAIIISIVLSTLFPKLDNNPYLLYPGICLLLVNLVTIILAILSVIPKTTHGIISREEVDRKEGNLMFFGNFHRMPIEDFEWGIDNIMNDKDYLYKTLTRDLFYLGKVLNRKYMFLRFGYYTFIIGLIVSIGVFIFYLERGGIWG